MDILQDYLPQLYSLYNTYYTTYQPYLSPLFRAALVMKSYFYRYLFPTFYPIYALTNTALRTLSSELPDVLSLLILTVILIVSIKVLDYMRRAVIYSIIMSIKFSMYAALLGVGMYVWQRGLVRSLEDFVWLWGLLEDFNEEGQKIGNRRARRSERQARRQAQAGRRGRTRGAGW